MPVLVLGLITVIIFIAIIISSQAGTHKEPTLIKQTPEEINKTRGIDTKNIKQTTQSSQSSGGSQTNSSAQANFIEVNGKKYPAPPKPGQVQKTFRSEEEKTDYLGAEMEEYERRTRIIQIDYTEAGFNPINPKVFTGQLIRWTNKTKNPIMLIQTLDRFDEFKGGVLIKPGESFEFRPTKKFYFAYIERDSKKYAGITIGDSTLPLINENPEDQF